MSKQTSSKKAPGKKAPGAQSAGPDGRATVPAPAAAPAPETDGAPSLEFSRRRLLGTGGAAGAAGLVVGGAGGAIGASAGQSLRRTPPKAADHRRLDRRSRSSGARQAGITTPLQARGHLVAFDLAPGADRKAAAALLRRWSARRPRS